jgi:heptosyltransferase I
MSPLLAHPPESLCLVRLSAIGDCCHTLPVVRTLQAAWPGTRITWIIGRTEHALLDGCAGIEFITFDKRTAAASLGDVHRQLAGRRFPLLLHMHASMRANLVSLLVRAPLRLGFDRARARDWQWLFTNRQVRAGEQQHVMDGLFGFAEALGITARELRWDIPVGAADRELAATLRRAGRPLCVISPCSSQRLRNFRNWPVARQVALACWLADEYDADIVVTGGNTALEREYGTAIASALDGRARNLVGQTTLKQLLAILAEAALLVCPDSGPAHMATAVGTPVVGLYATSNRLRTGPYLSQHLVVDRYPEAVAREFGPGAEPRWGARVRRPDAMELITLDDVKEKVGRVLGASR